jgi:solute carrier family 13 (sodium-dependent dicarboxylate transporter), member 2/3/5
MGNKENEKPQKEAMREAECRSCKRINWTAFATPRRLNSFIYSRRNLLFAVIVAFTAYFVASGQTEIVKRVAATFAFAASCWVLEVFPLPITGLTVPIMLTLLGVFSPQAAFAPFSNSVIFLIIGGLVLGQSIKKHGLDKWIGYNLMSYSRGKIDRLILLTMFVTAFLSMWMSNTVAAAVVIPIALSIFTAIPENLANLRKKMLLGISIGTSIGGMAMLTGSTPAMLATALLGGRLGFLQWAYYGLPVSLASLAVAFLILKKMFPSPKLTLDLTTILEQKNQSQGFSGSQKKVLVVFLGTIVLWFAGGQIEAMLGLSVSVSSAAIVSILAVLVMFGSDLLDLRDLQSIQWELMFLVGGGLLLGEAMISSGAAGQISRALSSLSGARLTVLLPLAFGAISLVLTNFMSNSATAAILIPVAIETAGLLGISPVPFVMAVALSAIIAFVTPVGVPSTALVYATGRVSKGELIKAGVVIAIPTLMISLLAVLVLPVP